MKLAIFAIKDRALDAFNRPLFVPTSGVAIRSFTDEVNRKESEMYSHAEDYDMYELGEFDDNTGLFKLLEVPRLVTRAQDVIIKE